MHSFHYSIQTTSTVLFTRITTGLSCFILIHNALQTTSLHVVVWEDLHLTDLGQLEPSASTNRSVSIRHQDTRIRNSIGYIKGRVVPLNAHQSPCAYFALIILVEAYRWYRISEPSDLFNTYLTSSSDWRSWRSTRHVRGFIARIFVTMSTNTDTRPRVRLKYWLKIECKRCMYGEKAYGILGYVSE